MIQLITPNNRQMFASELQAMHELRYRVFKKRLGWHVHVADGRELDLFDDLAPHYLLLRGNSGEISGCVRMLPSTGPTMLAAVFGDLLDGKAAPSHEDVWESSRFALDLDNNSCRSTRGLAQGTYELFAGMLEFGIARQLTRIVTVTDIRMERILRRAGWPLDRIGADKQIGNTRAVAGFLRVTREHLEAIRRVAGIAAPVLWAPVFADGD